MEIITNNQIIHLIASEGKVFKRIEDGVIMGKEIYLGNTYYLDDEQLENPIAEVANDYEEVDENSVEEKILELHAQKRELAADFLEGTSTSVKKMTEDDLMALLKA